MSDLDSRTHCYHQVRYVALFPLRLGLVRLYLTHTPLRGTRSQAPGTWVKVLQMAQSKSGRKVLSLPSAPAKAASSKPAQVASPLPTVATPPAAPAPAPKPATVALRGGAAVASVKLAGKVYRTAAPHNQQWWKVLSEAGAGEKTIPVASVAVSPTNPQGVPLHFIGYCLRRGYLTEVKA